MARKRFGQHFLTERGVIDDMVTAVAPGRDDAVVEIGPGRGALTHELLTHLGRLDVIEIDHDLAASLTNNFGPDTGLRLVAHNALDFDYTSHAQMRGKRLRLVGNLAYNIGTPLIFQTLGAIRAIQDMHFMLQKEVVDRIVAEPGDSAYGRLSIAVAVRACATRLFEVGPSAFHPAPSVTSAVIRITPRDHPVQITNWIIFDRLLASAFSHRRKTVSNALKQWMDTAELEALDIDPRRRPAELSPNDYIRLANAAAAR